MRYPALDLLRGIAIVWVMLFHSFVVGGLGPEWAWLSRYGWMGVDLFFVLSGFLIGTQVLMPLASGQRLDFTDFYLRRAFRILPAFLVVLAVYLAWPAFRESPGLAPWWMFVTFTLNLLVDYGRDAAFSHAWSLCVEEHFYLVFPLLATVMLRRPSALRFGVLCVAVVAAGIALRAGVWLHDSALDAAGAGLQRNWFIEDIYYPTWNRLDGLLAGVVLAVVKVFRPHTWQRLQQRGNAFALAGVAVMALALWLFRDRTGLLGNAVGWPVLSLGLACLVLAGTATNSALGRLHVPGAAWLAGISYSLYLTHKAVFHVTQTWLGRRWTGAASSRSPFTASARCWPGRCCITRWSGRSCACAAGCFAGAVRPWWPSRRSALGVGSCVGYALHRCWPNRQAAVRCCLSTSRQQAAATDRPTHRSLDVSTRMKKAAQCAAFWLQQSRSWMKAGAATAMHRHGFNTPANAAFVLPTQRSAAA